MCKRLICVVLVLGLVGAVSAADPNLVGSWLFQEGIEDAGATVAVDSSGNGNDGTLVGGASLLPDDPFGGLSLDGTGYVEVPASDSINISRDMTITAWLSVSSVTNWAGIVTRGNQAQTMGFHTATLSGNNYLRFSTLREFTDPTTGAVDPAYEKFDFSDVIDYGHVASVPLEVPTGEWIYVGISSDTKQLIFFMNGDTVLSGRQYIIPDSNEPLLIGADLVSNAYINGFMDDVHLYNRALTVLEMQELYDNMAVPYGPVPADGAINIGSGALSWHSIADAESEEVWVGTDPGDPNSLVKVADVEVGVNTHTITITPGLSYAWKIVTQTASGPVEGDIWAFSAGTVQASTPVPGDLGKTIPVDSVLTWEPGAGSVSSDIYFGDSTKLTVAQATKDSPEYQDNTNGKSFDPELEPGKWYYWRIDAVQADGSVVAGPVWSFRTMPDDVGFLDPNLVAWYRFETGFGREVADWTGNGNVGLFNTGDPNWVEEGYDGRGIALEDRGTADSDTIYFHRPSTDDITLMGWVKIDPSSPTRNNNSGPAFQGRPILWNDYPGATRNDYMVSFIGTKLAWMVGNPDTTIHSKSDINTGRWVHFAVTRERASGDMKLYINGREEDSATHTNLNPLNANSLFIMGNHGLKLDRGFTGEVDEFKFFNSVRTADQILRDMVPDLRLAWNPQPSDGQILSKDSTVQLSWSAGDDATAHDVYLGNHPDDLKLVSEAQTALTYDPTTVLEPGVTYYWRIDERQGEAVIEGNVWTFTISDYLIVDDFESYTFTYEDPDTDPQQVFLTWTDGLTASFEAASVITGSVVGYEVLEFGDVIMETASTYDGSSQAMPFLFNNTGNYGYGFQPTVSLSEISREISDAEKDWTRLDSDTLFIAWRGDEYTEEDLVGLVKVTPTDSDTLYVTVEDAAGAKAQVNWSGPVADLMDPNWHDWNIPLSEFEGVDMTGVKKLSLGIGNPDAPSTGGLGLIIVDEFRLYQLDGKE